MSGWALSIDVGTSNTAAAHTSAITGRIDTLPLTHQSNLLPSAVYLEATGTILTGQAATSAAHGDPSRYVPAPKRLVGQMPEMVLDGQSVTVEEMLAAVIAAAAGRAGALHNQQAPGRVVLTHPEAWSADQMRVLTDAASQAGIDPATIRTLSEPRAAAHHYSRATAPQPGTSIAVFDFGGGTLDVAVLTCTDRGGFEVVAARGDNTLGGKDFDRRIRQWLDERLALDDPGLAEAVSQASAHVQRSLDEQIRAAKESLSETPAASIVVDVGVGRRTVTITRDEFDAAIGRDVDRAVELARATLADAAQTGAGTVSALYLTGGSARVPLVHARLGALGPVATLDDPKTVVAQGALWALEDAPDGDDQGLDTVALPRPTPPPAEARSGGTRRRTALLVGAGVVALAVAAGGAAVALWSGEGGDTAVVAEPVAEVLDSADPRNVTDRLPQALASQLQDCRPFGFNREGGVSIICGFVEGSSLTVGRVADGAVMSLSAEAMSDTAAVQAMLAMRSYNEASDVRESADGESVLDVSGLREERVGSSTKLAHAGLGVTVSVQGVRDAEAAEGFFRDAGLFE